MLQRAPASVFTIDFRVILVEAKRQEQLHTANKGEYAVARTIFDYFDQTVFPLVHDNDWVYEAATKFAQNYANDCFRLNQLATEETWRLQKGLLALKSQVHDFVARAYLANGLTRAAARKLASKEGGTLAVKESDLGSILNWKRLSSDLRVEANALIHRARDHEPLQLLASLRAMRDSYEGILPKVLFVLRRVVKVEYSLDSTNADDRLLNPSETLDWYSSRLQPHHPLHFLLVDLATYYKTARNVGNHHEGFTWKPETNEVCLADRTRTEIVPLYVFQQRYRYFVGYLCDYGLRGILAAFAAREAGPVSQSLLEGYEKTFPKGSD